MPNLCSVLVIDDNTGDSGLMCEAMDSVGFDGVVMTVESGSQAFAYLSGRPPYANAPLPHVIMLDLNMPIHSGFDVLRELKAKPLWAAIPVMILSSSRQLADITKAKQLGAKRYVTKPADWNGYVEVARIVQEACCDVA